MTERILHNADEIREQLARLGAEIMREGRESPLLIGIHTNGVPLARRLAAMLEKAGHKRPDVGAIDITLYRDDLAGRALPRVLGSEIPFDLKGRRVVLVDDVLFTGRTVRAALTVLGDYGRPRTVELAVLVDRGHRELPIQANFTGLNLVTERADHVRVKLTESGASEDAVVLDRPDNGDET